MPKTTLGWVLVAEENVMDPHKGKPGSRRSDSRPWCPHINGAPLVLLPLGDSPVHTDRPLPLSPQAGHTVSSVSSVSSTPLNTREADSV